MKKYNFTTKDVNSILAVFVLQNVEPDENGSLQLGQIFNFFKGFVEEASNDKEGIDFLAGTLTTFVSDYMKDKEVSEIMKDFKEAKIKQLEAIS